MKIVEPKISTFYNAYNTCMIVFYDTIHLIAKSFGNCGATNWKVFCTLKMFGEIIISITILWNV